jgi:pimeloyl-ACP methyl ester carboxylesterase
MPLILTHGWPGSIVEFLKVIGPLTDPVAFGGNVEDSFDVVVPSLPGFGFSQKPTETGWTVSRIATAWVELMKRLGYKNWAAQGGDWGSVVTSALGVMRPEGLLGIHLNSQYAFPAQIPDTLSPEERYAVDTLALYTGDMGGANHFRARSQRPSDSPWRTLRLARRPGSTKSFNQRPTITGSPRTSSAPMRSWTRYRSTGSQTVPRRPAASTGRTKGPAWLAPN